MNFDLPILEIPVGPGGNKKLIARIPRDTTYRSTLRDTKQQYDGQPFNCNIMIKYF